MLLPFLGSVSNFLLHRFQCVLRSVSILLGLSEVRDSTIAIVGQAQLLFGFVGELIDSSQVQRTADFQLLLDSFDGGFHLTELLLQLFDVLRWTGRLPFRAPVGTRGLRPGPVPK